MAWSWKGSSSRVAVATSVFPCATTRRPRTGGSAKLSRSTGLRLFASLGILIPSSSVSLLGNLKINLLINAYPTPHLALFEPKGRDSKKRSCLPDKTMLLADHMINRCALRCSTCANTTIATGSTDFKARIFSAFIEGVDEGDPVRCFHPCGRTRGTRPGG